MDWSPRVQVGLKLPNCGGMFYEPDWVTTDNVIRLARAARDHGFDSTWLHDHVLTPRELRHLTAPAMLDCFIATAAVAAAVPEIDVGVAAVILPLRDPVILAKQVMTLEQFFPGRITIAVGAGQYESEFEAFGSDHFRRRGRVTDEYLAIIERLFTTSPATYRGDTRSIHDADFNPRPVRSHRPPLWVAGDSAAAARRARRFASTWLISPLLEPDRVGDVYHDGVGGDSTESPLPIALTMTFIPPLAAQPNEHAGGEHRLHQHGTVFGGEPDVVAADLNRYIKVGVSHLLVAFRCPDVDAVEDGMAWFNEWVRPQLAEPATDSSPRA